MEKENLITKNNIKIKSQIILEELLLYLKSNASRLAKDLGYNSNVKIQHIKSGRNNISVDIASDIVRRFPEINYDWLLTGEGSMLKEENKSRSVFEPENAEDEPTGYYYPNVNASAGLDISTLNEDIERLPMYLPLFGKGIDYINVYGDSMYPKYNAGEVIGIKEIEFQYLNYGYPYVVVFNNGDVYIKYVKKGKDENHVLLESENTFYEPREFHLELIKSFYSIRGVVKKEMM